MTHEISLAVWDLASPAVAGRRARLKAGISCPHGCVLAGTTIEIRDEQETVLGRGVAGADPWHGSFALYWSDIEIAVPAVEGEHVWSVRATPAAPEHGALSGSVRVIATQPPEHRVTIDVVEQGSGRPLGDVELRVGIFRTTTDEEGRAHVDVPGGTYDVHAWKPGYDLHSSRASVAADIALQLEVAVTPQREQPYWM